MEEILKRKDEIVWALRCGMSVADACDGCDYYKTEYSCDGIVYKERWCDNTSMKRDAADMIEAQAARIAELEAELKLIGNIYDNKKVMKPILFNTEMVKAILDGRKTVTRRLIRPLYQPGNILYVRETWLQFKDKYYYRAGNDGVSALSDKGIAFKWRASIHMPKEAARIFLRVTEVRTERLQSISDDGACDEGAEGTPCGDCGERDYGSRYEFCTTCANTGWVNPPREEFKSIWDTTIKPKDLDRYGWAANPWVWVIEFERISKEEAEREAV